MITGFEVLQNEVGGALALNSNVLEAGAIGLPDQRMGEALNALNAVEAVEAAFGREGPRADRSQPAGAGRTGLKCVGQESKPARSQRVALRDGREVTLRAIAETDAPAIQRAFDHLSSQSRYSRFLQHKKHLDPAALTRGVHPQPGQGFALVATVPRPEGVDIVGGAQYVRASPTDGSTCEFAITVAEDWRGCGLARELLAGLLHRAPCDHYETMVGLVLADNSPMLALAHKLGFRVEPSSHGDSVVQVLRQLKPAGDGPGDSPSPP